MSSPPFAAEVAAGRSAQRSWSRWTVAGRLRATRALRHLIVDRASELFTVVEADVGRPAVEVLATELLPTASALKFLEQEAIRLLKPRRVSGRLRPTWLLGSRDRVHRRPWGVVAIIGTWNYPIYLNVVQIAQALVAGNAVLWKPSENAPRTADLTHQLFLEAGFPADLFIKLSATREAGLQVAEADVDHVVFTGSDGVGRKLAARLGERLIPSTLELSGCDALFVLEDADVELAARSAWFGVTLNRGQTCIAVRRVFVQRGRYAAFAEALKPLVAKAGPLPLVTHGQADQAERLVRESVERGARLLVTPHNEAVGGRGVRPAVVLDATVNMSVCREASFAPVSAVIPFETVDEAVSLASTCPFGLGASIFTARTQAAQDLAARLSVGSVTINDVLAPTAHPATPFGGRGASGWGVTQGAEGLLGMTTPQTVTVRKGRFRPHVDEAVTPDPATLEILHGLLRASHARGIREWLGGVRQLLRGLRYKKK